MFPVETAVYFSVNVLDFLTIFTKYLWNSFSISLLSVTSPFSIVIIKMTCAKHEVRNVNFTENFAYVLKK